MARRRSSGETTTVLGFVSSIIFLALISFAVLSWLDMPAGTFLDWIVGIISFAWLVTVVTVPWNIYFEAREVLLESRISQKKNIEFDASQLGYVRRLNRWSLIGALFLHIISAAILYWIAYSQISVVGYYAAGMALLLTFFRPAIRAYEYISSRLAQIREEIKYPREDVATLVQDVQFLQEDLKSIQYLLNSGEEDSWLSKVERDLRKHQEHLEQLQNLLHQQAQENQQEHERIAQETRHAVAQLSEDGKFIDNLVEIIRFIKKV